ncbi:hypothetical protein AVEN_236201-1 [Araneus ventricosus]|uniref:Uncharacterized protein n=1 Tax=Araneus ventricosus TaxID=182803 RepID=A0A4Y2VHF9_ARAVE|nr:hypothetical protein AVEN_236201-1 [Araneus ventricosus]
MMILVKDETRDDKSKEIFVSSVLYCPTATRKTSDTRPADGSRYGNGIFHCILGVKERALFHLVQTEPAEVSFRFVLWWKTNSSPYQFCTVLPPRGKPQISDLRMAVIIETVYSTVFWG